MFRRSVRLTQFALLAVLAVAAFTSSAGAASPVMSIGYSHLCAVEPSGTLKCAGDNDYGKVDNTNVPGYKLAAEVNLGGAKAIATAVGYASTCVILEGGSVKCWGSGNVGQLGNGADLDSLLPVDVALGGARAVSIGGGEAHFCALIDDGSVRCWGDNYFGQLGTGAGPYSENTPVTPSFGGRSVVSLSVGQHTTCAVLSDRSAACWGLNTNSEVAPGGGPFVYLPTDLDFGGTNVREISTDDQHSCALLEPAVVKCWGSNFDWALGDGTQTSTGTPVTVDFGAETPTHIDVGWYQSCASMQSGLVKCWGSNEYGALGLGQAVTHSGTPATYDAADQNISTFYADKGGTCVVLTTGAVKCSGYAMAPMAGLAPNNLYEPTTILGLSLLPPAPSVTAPSDPSPIQGTIVKPKWKLKRASSKVTASATLTVTAPGMDAAHCVGNLQVSVPAASSGDGVGSGKAATAPTYALKFSNGKCAASAKRSVPLRVAKKGVRLKVYLKNATLLRARSVTTTTSLPTN